MSRKFDTLDQTVALEKAGVSRSHAQAIVKTVDQGRTGMVPSHDFERFRSEFRLVTGVHLAITLASLGILVTILMTLR